MRLPVSVHGQWPQTHGCFSAEMMRSVRALGAHLLGLCLMCFTDQGCCCSYTGSLPLKPNISHLEAFSDKQSLVVSWLRNHGAVEKDVYEIQISRTESYNVMYSRNVSLAAGASAEHSWTWFSDLPLECVDHSVRIRHFCGQTGPSPWSNWKTSYGVREKNKIKIFPFQRVLEEGTTATFCCVPPAGVSVTNITFMSNQYHLLSVGAGVKAIFVHNLTIPDTFYKILPLTCTVSTGKMHSTLNYISFPPQKPRNISCVTSDMKTVTCSWDSGRKRESNDRNKQTHTLHIENSDQAPITCEPSSCTFPVVPQLQEYNIRVVVKDQLGEEMESHSFNTSERVFPVLEWDGVNPGVTDVSLYWRVQGNLTQMNLLCQVEIISVRITEVICNSVRDLCKAKVEQLHPNTYYSTRVRCSVNRRLWGRWTQPRSFRTDPLVTLDLWRRIEHLSDSPSRQVTLLWNPSVSGGASTVNIQGYKLEWSQDGRISTQLTDSGQNQAKIFIGPAECEVTVQAVLQKGSSVPASITISPKDDSETLPLKRRLSGTSAGGFNLSWDEQSTVTCGYTVEWCILGSTAPCTLQWMKVPEGNNTVFLSGHFKAGCRYSFSIYGCSENGHTLLEIQTGYTQELRYVQSPSLIKPAQITSSSVTLEWDYNEDDPAQPAFITGYLVTVQETGADAEQAAGLFNVSVGDPHQKSVIVNGLQQQQEYTCSVSALTGQGPGIPVKITIRTRTNYSSHLAKILTPVLLLLGCIILLWPQRKMLKNGLREIFTYPAGMNIKTPEFDSFLYEINQKLWSQKVEECISCHIEILNIKPLLHETTTPMDPELTNSPYSHGSQSSLSPSPPSCLPIQSGYRPQSSSPLCGKPTNQQMTSITNRSYLSTNVEDEPQFSERSSSFEPPDCLQESRPEEPG